jgi:hypothetical protein
MGCIGKIAHKEYIKSALLDFKSRSYIFSDFKSEKAIRNSDPK